MIEFFRNLFSADFMPHGHCMFWQPGVLWLHIISDIVIALAYYSIPIALIYLVRKRKDLAFNSIFMMFAIFILACGTNHIIDVWTLWNPVYRFEGMMKLVTATASIATATAIWPLIPKVLEMPSPLQLEEVNSELQLQIQERQKAEENLKSAYKNLQRLVDKRTEELKNANEALQESEQKYQQLYDSAPDMFVSVDPASTCITQCNKTLADKLGFSKEEIIGKPVFSLYHPDCKDDVDEVFQSFASTGEVKNADLYVRRKDGGKVPVRLNVSAVKDEEGKILMSSSVLRDITELEKAQSALRANEERFRVMLESLPNAIVVVDDSGLIELMNVKAEQYFEFEKDEIIGKPLDTLIPHRFKDDHSSYFQSYWQDPTPRRMGINRDLYARKKNGDEFPVEVGLTPCRINQKTFIISSIIDISERKASEKALKENSEALARSNAELQQFAYIASHDLQEPLRKVSSFAQKLAAKYQGQLDEKADQYIHFIVDGATRMKSLITELLDFSRLDRQEIRFDAFDCNLAINQVLATMEETIAENNAVVEIEDLPVVYGNRSQLERIFQNLIGNALKFRASDPPRITIGLEGQDSEWLFVVRDNGIGIDPQFLDQIFVIFKRLHSRFEYTGSGIGLAICKKIIEHHGGRIWAESDPGQGSVFYFTLPKNPVSLKEPAPLGDPGHPLGGD